MTKKQLNSAIRATRNRNALDYDYGVNYDLIWAQLLDGRRPGLTLHEDGSATLVMPDFAEWHFMPQPEESLRRKVVNALTDLGRKRLRAA